MPPFCFEVLSIKYFLGPSLGPGMVSLGTHVKDLFVFDVLSVKYYPPRRFRRRSGQAGDPTKRNQENPGTARGLGGAADVREAKGVADASTTGRTFR